jgi:hypothetical protein
MLENAAESPASSACFMGQFLWESHKNHLRSSKILFLNLEYAQFSIKPKAILYLYSVSLVPTFWEGQSICINETNKLSMMLNFVFKEVEG